MSSLRRDLFERKLWLVLVLLVVAIIAVPLLLRKNAVADVAAVPPAPPLAGAVAPAQRTSSRPSFRALQISMPRNPFASGMPKLNAKPVSQSKSTSSSPATGASSTTSTTSPSMVSPSPSTASSSSTTTTQATSSTTTPTTTTTTTSTTSTPTTSTTTTTSGPPSVPAVQSWTVYSVGVRVGTGSFAPLQSDVARLTPLPSVAAPKAMFIGVMAGGRQAVFALGAGVQHSGPGICRPDRARCAAIVLRVGETEQITAAAAGGPRLLNLRLASITARVTHSHDEALAAFQRHSAAGLCELDLADPLTYSQGTVSAVTASVCKNHRAAVPFPGGLAAP